jgi:hypothetical protein
MRWVEYCPRCNGELKSRRLDQNKEPLLACFDCKMIAIKGDTKWFSGDDDKVMKALEDRMREIEEESAAMRAEDDDPRWERVL